MNNEQFFMLINEIDQDMAEDALVGGEKNSENIPAKKSSPAIVKSAIAAAACMAVLAAGIFFVYRNRGIDIIEPESSGFDIELTESNTEALISYDTTENSPESEGYVFEFDYKNGAFNFPRCEEKTSNDAYAVIYIKDTSADEDNPVSLSVYSAKIDDDGFLTPNQCISETIKITAAGEYKIYYNGLRDAGSLKFLYPEADFEGAWLWGTWIP